MEQYIFDVPGSSTEFNGNFHCPLIEDYCRREFNNDVHNIMGNKLTDRIVQLLFVNTPKKDNHFHTFEFESETYICHIHEDLWEKYKNKLYVEYTTKEIELGD